MIRKTLLLAGSRKQKNSLIGIGILMFVTIVSLLTAVTVYGNAGKYISQEMERVGFGTFTAWVSGYSDLDGLQEEIEAQAGVSQVTAQPVIFSGYSIGDVSSDNEGELLAYQPEQYPYVFFSDDLQEHVGEVTIEEGEIYLSPVMQSTFGAEIGDEVHFRLSRGTTEQVFTVAGFFEDPFMGSSMIDMKSFLINEADYQAVVEVLAEVSDFDRLGRVGAMLHIFAQEPLESVSALNQELTGSTSLGRYTEMMYSADSIYGFMLILQNILTGFLMAFSILLLVVIFIVTANTIRNSMAQEFQDIGILKAIGCSGDMIWQVQILQNMIPIVAGMLTGILAAIPISQLAVNLTITSVGVRMPAQLPMLLVMGLCVGILAVFFLFVRYQTRHILQIRPMQAILEQQNEVSGHRWRNPMYPTKLGISLAIRQLLDGWKRYVGVWLVMLLLTVFLSVVGRMSDWVGPNGEGLMNAFSVAEHDLGVQPVNQELDMEEVRDVILTFSPIEDTYELAMQNGTVEGVDYTINVLDEPEWFHMIEGSNVKAAEELLVTAFVAEDLGVAIGDEVTVTSGGSGAVYKIAGIYECANGMGGNVGMSREGYARIANVNDNIWCTHYILENGALRDTVMDALMSRYRLDADMHTNSWSGLDGIVSTLHMLIVLMYGIAVLIICIVIALSSTKVLAFEQKNLAIYKSIGFTSKQLRISFGLRYGMVAAAGVIVGSLVSAVMTDRIVGGLLRNFGIGDFRTTISIGQMLMTAAALMILAFLFALLSSRRVKRVSVTELLQRE